MNKEKFRPGFLSFFFFFQGVFITVMILFAVFDKKVVPVIKEKNTQIEMLVNELNKINKNNYNHYYKDYNEKTYPKNLIILNIRNTKTQDFFLFCI